MRKARIRAHVNDDDDEGPAGAIAPEIAAEATPLVMQLDSLDAGEREEALEALEQIAVLSPELVPRLVRESGMADKLGSRLCDPKARARELAAALTRALCQAGGEAIVELLVRGDVLTPLLDVFGKTKVTMAIVDAGVREQVFGIAREVLGAMHELCQRSETAVGLVAASPHVGSLIDYLDPAFALPMDVRCPAAHVLQDLVEDVPLVADAIRSNPRAMTLIQQAADASPDLLLRALCCGVRFELDNDCSRCVQGVMPALSLQLPQGLMAMKNEAIAAGTETAAHEINEMKRAEARQKEEGGEGEEEGEGGEQKDGMLIDLPTVPRTGSGAGPAAKAFSQMLDQWQHAAQAQQQALETLANVFGSGTIAASDEAKIVEATMPLLTGMTSLQIATVEAQFGEQVLSALPPLDGSVDKLQLLQLRALHCLNNALISVAPQRLLAWTGPLWVALVDRLREAAAALAELETPNGDDELLDAIAACIWSMGRAELPVPVAPEHLALFSQTLLRRLSPSASASLAGALGAQHRAVRDTGALAPVSGALLTACGEGGDALIMAEALNSLVDLFSDDATHAAFVQMELGSKLSQILARAKKMPVAAEEDGERLHEVAETVREFLAYKKRN